MNKLPEHLFVSSVDGGLYDTRKPDWAKHPVRPIYERQFGRISDTHELRATLRAGKWAWPGGYPLFLVASGEPFCFHCAVKEYRWLRQSGRFDFDKRHNLSCAINYEDPDLVCDACGERIESAYAEE